MILTEMNQRMLVRESQFLNFWLSPFSQNLFSFECYTHGSTQSQLGNLDPAHYAEN
jgi:hypothetical protein